MRLKGVRVRALVAMVLGATLFGSSDADAVLCVKSKKGVTKVTIRGAACKGNESVGDPIALLGLPTTTTSSTTTTTLAGERAARIVDSAGNDVAWVNPNVGLLGHGLWALGTSGDQAITFPMSSSGPAVIDGLKALGYVASYLAPIARDDFNYGFMHEGSDCEGDLIVPLPSVLLILGNSDLVKIAYPSLDGKSGYVIGDELRAGVWSQDVFQPECATPPDPVPTTVACMDPTEGQLGVVPVGSAYPCQLPGQLPDTTQCTCRRCCATWKAALPYFPIQTIDLGLGDSKPPFKVEN